MRYSPNKIVKAAGNNLFLTSLNASLYNTCTEIVPQTQAIPVTIRMADSTAKATANIKKNRLYVTIAGNVDAKALEKLYTDIRFGVADLKPGFEVISDISQCNLIYISGFPVYKKIIDYLISQQLGEIVRIIRNDNISFRQMINFTDKIHCYRSIYAESKDEAEQKLDHLIKRDGIRFRINTVQFSYVIGERQSQGSVVDISISGCAVTSSGVSPDFGEHIRVSLGFEPHESYCAEFHLEAKVVRIEETAFAVRFLDCDEDSKRALYKRLAYEVSRVAFIL